MLLTYKAICRLLESGVVLNSGIEFVNPSSLDLTLDKTILVEAGPFPIIHRISIRDKQPLIMHSIDIPEDGWVLGPGEFILASSQQVFNLPRHISAQYALKSTIARQALEHSNAGWCDPGWNGSKLTMEIKNISQFHHLHLHVGDRIGQLKFFKHAPVPIEHSYAAKGRYNGDLKATGAKK